MPGLDRVAMSGGSMPARRQSAGLRDAVQPEHLDGLLLAPDASRYMTGTVIAGDGGHPVNTLYSQSL
jgi:hypothetical protein